MMTLQASAAQRAHGHRWPLPLLMLMRVEGNKSAFLDKRGVQIFRRGSPALVNIHDRVGRAEAGDDNHDACKNRECIFCHDERQFGR